LTQPLFSDTPALHDACMVLAFSGWMDGGGVSTGTVGYLTDACAATKAGSLPTDDFYILSFPASMEVSALVRPATRVADGRVQYVEMPDNTIRCSAPDNLVLFEGKEPHLRWEAFASCLFTAVDRLNVRLLVFVGSVSGAIPHTRPPRVFASGTSDRLLDELQRAGAELSDYEGPASFVTYLMTQAERKGLEMCSLVAEIPAYVQGDYPVAIESLLRLITGLHPIGVDLDLAARASSSFRKRLDELVRKRADLRELVSKLEAEYDRETHASRMDDLREWFEKQNLPPE